MDSYAVIRVSMVTGAPGLVKVFDDATSADDAVNLATDLAAVSGDLYKFEVIGLTKRDKAPRN